MQSFSDNGLMVFDNVPHLNEVRYIKAITFSA